jgi:hypothetical protein
MRKLWLPLIAAGLLVTSSAMAEVAVGAKLEPQYITDYCSKLNAALTTGTHEGKSQASLELAIMYMILTDAPTNFTLNQMYDKLTKMFKDDPKFLKVYLSITKECKQSPDKTVGEVIRKVMGVK